MPSTLAISYIINLLKLWFHLISKINIIQSVHIHILHPLHPKSLIINVYWRTSALMTSKLNLLIVLATILHSNIVPLATSLGEDLSKIDNENLRKIIGKGPKYHDPQTINWKYNFKVLMDSVEDYTRKGTTREK